MTTSKGQALQLYAQNYQAGREALVSLGASKDRFQILDWSHLKTSTMLINPKESGCKHDSLPWFWYMDVEGGSLSSNYMKECEWMKD
ncbi:hypothetical protein L208DRAFT_1231551 [Tricholoma matsutake]|nr:hypothetical protein L208DRAFT_1231551 [Tricholoma matsutake 945]